MDTFGEICDMFTGIIETTGFIKNMAVSGSNRSFWIESSISQELRVDQSISHSGTELLGARTYRQQSRRQRCDPETSRRFRVRVNKVMSVELVHGR